jgi:hypothetical protein
VPKPENTKKIDWLDQTKKKVSHPPKIDPKIDPKIKTKMQQNYNKFSKLQDDILWALDNAHRDGARGWLLNLHKKYPTVASRLIERLLPRQINAEISGSQSQPFNFIMRLQAPAKTTHVVGDGNLGGNAIEGVARQVASLPVIAEGIESETLDSDTQDQVEGIVIDHKQSNEIR